MRKGGLLNQLLKLEEGFTEYERTGSRLEDNIKFAILKKCVSGQLKTWLQLIVAESQSYSKLREAVIQYDGATLRWSSAMMLGQESKDGAVPMEKARAMQRKAKGPKGKGQKGQESEPQRKRLERRCQGKARVHRKGQKEQDVNPQSEAQCYV